MINDHARARLYLEFLQLTSSGGHPKRYEYDEELNKRMAEGVARAQYGSIDDAQFKQLVDNLLQTTKQHYEDIPTPYEDPLVYSILTSLVNDLEETGREVEWDLPPRPLLGTLDTGQVNAVTVRVPETTDYLILFEGGLTTFALLLGKAVAAACPVSSQGEGYRFQADIELVRQRLDENDQIVMRFADVVAAYSVTGNPARAEQYLLEGPHTHLASVFRDSMEYFVLGHEYGHILFGHLEKATHSAGILPVATAEALEYSWRQELEADQYGVLFGTSCMLRRKRMDLAMGFSGADLFFAALDIMDRSVSLLRTGNEDSQTLGSHPPAFFRGERARTTLGELVDDKEQVSAAIKLASSISEIMEELWIRARPVIMRLRSNGVPAWTGWRAQDKPKPGGQPL